MPSCTIKISALEAIYVTYEVGGSGKIESHGLKGGKRLIQLNAAIDGMESLILAMACNGVDITTEKMKQAICTAVEAINNNN
jgi:hypothetical protein